MNDFLISNDLLSRPEALRKRMRDDGFLYLRDMLPRNEIFELRRQILDICRDAGWLIEGTDPMAGLSRHAPLKEGDLEWRPVYARVQALESFHRLKLHTGVQRIMDELFEERSFALPMTVGRLAFPSPPELVTQPHQDWLYVGGSTEIITGWVPLGDVPRYIGGLKLLRGSHKAGFLVPQPSAGAGGNTVAVDPTLDWLTADFRAGDLLLFKALTVHAAAPNHTPDHMRISLDFRYAGFSHTITDHWLEPHMHWLGEPFSWPTLQKDWGGASSTADYWKRLPRIRTKPRDILWKRREKDESGQTIDRAAT